MQKTAENSKKPINTKRKALIIILFLLAAISAWFTKDYVKERFNSGNQSFEIKQAQTVDHISTTPVNYKEFQDNSTIQSQTALEDKEPVSIALEPYSTGQMQGTIEPDLKQSAHDIITHVDNYRNYLLNVNSLITNFLQDKIYSNQIAYVRMVGLPPSINAIMELFEDYNVNYLVSPGKEYKKIFPEDYKIMKKFVKIKKTTKAAKEKERLRANIINNLEIFQDYIYSGELQKLFIGQRE